MKKYFKKYGFLFRKIFLLLLCLKFLLMDPLSCLSAKAQEESDFNLVTLQSPQVSFDTSLLPTTLKLSSSPVSFSTSNLASVIKLSSNPVSFSTTNLASEIKLSSNPVSYFISQTADLIKLASLPVSYSLTSFTGETIKLLSDNVAYRVYNGIPILDLVSPNLLPISQDNKSIDINLQGDNFVKDAVVSIGTLKIQTKYVSQKELTATIPVNFLNKENTFELFVANPPPEGGVSTGFNVMVVDPIPIAKINASPSIGVAPQIVTFDGKDTEDLLSKYFGGALSYRWSFGEQDAGDLNTSQDPVVPHTYKTPGKYTVSLNVVNAYGKVSTVTKLIEIREKNFAPDGTFVIDKINGDVPLNISFTPNITDAENDNITYLWEFGDGQTSIETNPSHTYIIPGEYQPKLTVSDLLGAKTVITSGRLTLLPPNNLPITQISAVPKESTLKLNNEGLFTSTVQFVSNGTYDPDGEELTYLWEFGDNATSNEINPKHEYKNAGNYNVKLIVTDSRNGENLQTISTIVSKPQPTAIAKLDQTTGNAPFEVTFDGTNSQDYDGSPVILNWDFGDGIKGDTGTIKHTYTDPGVYLVSLTALTADNRFIKINPGNIIVGPNNGPVGQIIKLEGDEKGILGKARIKLSAAGSYDPGISTPNSQPSLKYKWSWSARTWDVNGNLVDVSKEVNDELEAVIARSEATKQSSDVSLSEIASPSARNDNEIFEYTFTRAGQFIPVLEIEKADGTKAKFFGETFTITPDQAPVAVAKIISEKTVGEPGLEINFDGSESYDPKANGGLKILTWDFGDGEKSTEVSPKHIYNKEGTFTPTLTVVDNANNIGFAQSSSIKITNQIKDTNGNILARMSLRGSETTEAIFKRYEIASSVLSEPPRNDIETSAEIQSTIDAMTKEATDVFISHDNKKPEIGPVTLEPKTVSAGGVVRLSGFIKDDTALSNFGYTLNSADGKVITQKVIDLINKNEDNILTNEQYVEENINIPKDLLPGTYKVKLTATDTNGNQIAKNNPSAQNTNEEITLTVDVINQISDKTSSTDRIILPSEVEKEQTPHVIARSEMTKQSRKRFHQYEIASPEPALSEANVARNDKPDLSRFFVRGKNIVVDDERSSQKGEVNEAISKTRKVASSSAQITKTTKFQIDNFQITGFTQIFDPWLSIGPSSTKTLDIDTIAERDGYIEIGTKGSLPSNYFSKWYTTNIYVDYKKIGTVPWYFGAGLSFTSDVSNPVKRVEFRPADNYGNELSSVTWVSKNFIFTKIIQPQVTSIFPTEGTAGRGAFDLRINGNNFTTTSKVYFDGYLLSPFAISINTLYVHIPAYLVSYLGFKTVSVLNSDGSQSGTQYYTAKANQNNPCNINKTLPQTYWGADAQTILDGNNTFLSSPSAIIEGTGSVTIPFCLDTNHDVTPSLNLQHYKNSFGRVNNISFWIDGNYIAGSSTSTSQSLSFNKIATRNLSGGLHELKISFNGQSTDQLRVDNVTFSNGGIILDSIDPTFVTIEGTGRVLNLYGSNFDQSINVVLDNQALTKLSLTSNKITVSLPDKFSSIGPKPVQLIGNGKQSSILQLSVKNPVELINSSFKVTPVQPFPGSSFDIELRAKDNQAGAYTATIAIYDPDGKLLTTPNISNGYSTIVLSSVKDLNGDLLFKGSIPLSLQTKAGNYTAIAYVKRISGSDEDYSSIEAAKYIAATALGLTYSDSSIPASHRLTFTPKPAVQTVFGIEENNSENVGFVQVGNKVIQDGQSIKYKIQISTGTENASKLRYNFKSGDGRESGLIVDDNFTFNYQNTSFRADASSAPTTPLTANPKVEIFWIENGIQTNIRTQNGPTLFIYSNYSPIAKAKVLGNTYATAPPLFTTFVDLDSYDPNQRFSSAIDFVDSTNNKWDLYQLKFSQDAQFISLPVNGKISEDGKTFFSGDIYTPGSYFARLTVRDKTGLTDTASTESVTLTKPSQMVIVFATTDPSDKKVYNPSEFVNGIVPVKFKSTVTPLGSNAQSIVYKWDFGDGSCTNSNLPNDCTSPNPTHYYFDRKKSFNGTQFIDRKSVTPKVTVTTTFKNGTQETWEACASTITFNAEPNFVLLDLRPDTTEGVIPFTVNLMIDSTTAKAVNATILKYELDWNDGSPVIASEAKQSQTEITLQDILSQTFTHTYTKAGTYSPKLTVYIKESTKTFTFYVPEITAAGTGVGGVYLLDDLNQLAFTNQPIVTFMLLTSFANPSDSNNSLKIKVKDEDGNETVTELDPSSQNQTISLSEGKNTYYFETSDSSNQVIMSEMRDIILDTEKPVLEIISPNENDLVSDKLIISGIIEDQLFDSISYKINSTSNETRIANDDLEELGENKKAFNVTLDPNVLGTEISKADISVKDKAGNITSDEVNIGSDQTVKLLSKEALSSATIIRNDGTSHQVKQGEPFQLSTTANICDDTQKKGSDYQSKLIISSNSYTINGTENKITYQNSSDADGFTNFVPGAAGLLNGCETDKDIFYSGVFNANTTVNELFLPASPFGNSTLSWPIGKYTIEQTLIAAPKSLSTYGTTFENNSLTTMSTFLVEVTRNINAEITALKPQNILWNKENNITFNLNLTDSIPANDKDHLPTVGQAFIRTPSGNIDNVNLNCNYETNISYPVRELTTNCSFSYTPIERTKDSASYTLTVPVSFSPDSGNLTDTRPSFTAEYKDLKSSIEIAAKIIQPEEYTVIQSSKVLIKSVLDKTKLPADLQTLTPDETDKIKNLAKYGIRFGSNGAIRTVTSRNNYDSVIKGIMTSSLDENTIGFEYNLNFNLSTENNFKDAFENLSAIGPIFLYNEISSLSPLSSTFPTESYAEPQKLILLDKSNVKGTLNNNLKTNNKVLNLTIKNNVSGYGPKGKNFPLELIIEPKDASGMLLGIPGEFNKSVLIPKTLQPVIRKIDNLPPETTEVLLTLNRSDDFLNFIQDKLNKNNFNFNILNGQFKTVSSVPVKLGTNQTTSCTLNPDSGNTNQNIDFHYSLKSVKSVNISLDGKKSDGTIVKQIPLPTQFKNKTDWAKSGIISFTIPEEWSIYSEVIFTLNSGGEGDVCVLKISNSSFFTESSKETDFIKLPFVINGTASIPDDTILGIKGVSFPSTDELTLKDLKQLLKDLKLLSESNNNGFDLETQEATYELLYTIDQLRCALRDNTDGSSNLKAQVANPLLTCSISTSNYLEYISTSIETNLPYVISLINSSNTLRTIGITSPQISITGLADSVLLRGLANAVAIGTLTAPEIAGIAFVGLILYSTLSNASLKADANTSTCTNTFGIVDRRFFIGKDLNNNDIKRTNTMVSVSATNNLYNSNLNVIEPFPHIPLQPGIFSGCIQDGEYTFTLKFNDLSTFTMTGTVQKSNLGFSLTPVTSFWGGVFRKYGKPSTIPKIVDSRLILNTLDGDIQTILNPTGAGAYLTRVSLTPNIDINSGVIADALRLYIPDTFEVGNPTSKGEIETGKADAFIDLAIDTTTINFHTNETFPLQYVIPNQQLQFGYPNGQSKAILIDRYGG